jgi:hypothetical protein
MREESFEFRKPIKTPLELVSCSFTWPDQTQATSLIIDGTYEAK